MPKTAKAAVCDGAAHDGATPCALDADHLGNHKSDDGHEWANERDLYAPPAPTDD